MVHRTCSKLALLAVGIFAGAPFALCGCSTVGPTSQQSADGQTVTNTPNNTAAFIDDNGTTSFNSSGPIEIIKQTRDQTEAQSSGMVTRTLTVQRPDGLSLTLRSGSDARGLIEADAVTGNVKRFEFETSSSAPLRELGDVQAKLQASIQAIAREQGVTYQAAYRSVVDSLDTLQPSIAALLRGIFPVVP